MCPHSLKPGPCSSCLGAPARRVEQVGAEILIDGVAVREIEPDRDPHIQQPRKQRRR